ncbi:MAG: acetyl-CoA carboxylase carboxyltransferase subunit alpha [Chlamydiia bacterium]|nr:acetyl-CoA carboxylase carboxyltransferase subunit alpha [Chlamydiia bacterium]MCP5508904.1 acetyl-CoA carboxylase carboxyltransferase subunit alpha [Chlamydiales bacterium]HPE84874.1 acetyl-CoA carboxylase carboxyltransferase subunit alpha [Chlamydiales bacterium]
MLNHEKGINEYEGTLKRLKDQHTLGGIWSDEEIVKLEKKLEELKGKVYSQLTPWERVEISRHPNRPRSIGYIKHLCESFEELFGDRLFQDDQAIIGGLGIIGGQKFVIIAQEKGNDTESRLKRNFGMPHPEGYRKALRLMKLAEKFKLPVLSLIDTPGAHPCLAAEERGQGSAIAVNLMEMARLKTPMIVLLIGEACSGGALAMALGDTIGMLEHSYYAVISPEGCASILWKDHSMKETAAEKLKMQAEDLLAMGIIDAIIDEPLGGAHHDTGAVYQSVKTFILAEHKKLQNIEIDELLELRYQKYRKLGAFQSDPVTV